MRKEFGGIQFSERCGQISAYAFREPVSAPLNVSDVRVAGENIRIQSSSKQAFATAAVRFREILHEPNRMQIICESDSCIVRTILEKMGGGVRVRVAVTNRTSDDIVLEGVPVLNLCGVGGAEAHLYRFYNSHHAECQPIRLRFADCGLFASDHCTFKRISGVNVGSWSSKEELPQLIIENGDSARFMMAQIESCGSWYWEIGETAENEAYLSLSGGNADFTGWSKRLRPGEEYISVSVAVCFGDSLNETLANMTTYRRSTLALTPADDRQYTVFNEYMHLSWDSPDKTRTHELIPVVAKTGADVYVIDCGWHDEVDGNMIYPYVGNWRESRLRFPGGLRETTDFIRSFGMKAGLWIEPEVVGAYSGVEYPADAYISSFGKRKSVAGRYFLDFRHPEVRRRMSDAIARMILEYGADYIKIDCNQDSGVGTDINVCSRGEGAELTTDAFWRWLNEERQKYPNVIFESCASGGMRLDWKSMHVSSLTSTSDQVDYKKYPYIVGNIFAAVLPEQAGFWSYPVEDASFMGRAVHVVSDDEVVMNMTNAILGRLHLASDLRKLSTAQFELVREGIRYMKSIIDFKMCAVPYLPFGFAAFGEQKVAVGLSAGDRLLLGVWNLGEKGTIAVPLENLHPAEVCVGYPKDTDAVAALDGNTLKLVMRLYTSVILEIRCGNVCKEPQFSK